MDTNNTRTDNFSMGSYSSGNKKGIRNYIYSTSLDTNPSTYAYIRQPGYWGVHAKGEVWAAILYEVFWNLADKHGLDMDWFNLEVGGNKIALQIVVDGLKLQPCRPSFVDARDAILLADETRYGGDNYCEIYRGFAKRGLGFEAAEGGREDFSLPVICTK
jgi:extracellular elastinolytic metalloproteinase